MAVVIMGNETYRAVHLFGVLYPEKQVHFNDVFVYVNPFIEGDHASYCFVQHALMSRVLVLFLKAVSSVAVFFFGVFYGVRASTFELLYRCSDRAAYTVFFGDAICDTAGVFFVKQLDAAGWELAQGVVVLKGEQLQFVVVKVVFDGVHVVQKNTYADVRLAARQRLVYLVHQCEAFAANGFVVLFVQLFVNVKRI